MDCTEGKLWTSKTNVYCGVLINLVWLIEVCLRSGHFVSAKSWYNVIKFVYTLLLFLWINNVCSSVSIVCSWFTVPESQNPNQLCAKWSEITWQSHQQVSLPFSVRIITSLQLGWRNLPIVRLEQERCNSIANALELIFLALTHGLMYSYVIIP